MRPAETPAYFTVRVLTHDYLVDGWLEKKTETNRLSVYGYRSDLEAPLWLASPRLYPAHELAGELPAGDAPTGGRAAVYPDSIVAVIPADPAAIEAVAKQNGPFQYPLPVELRAGRYRIRGSVLCSDKQLRNFEQVRVLLLREAEIDCLLPNSRLVGLKAPYALVMAPQVQALLPTG